MKKFTCLFILMFLIVVTTGCVSSNAGRGAGLGAALGALGSVIGKGDGRTTALYAGGGALLGYALGNEVDKSDAANETYSNRRDINDLQSRRDHVQYNDRHIHHHHDRPVIYDNRYNDSYEVYDGRSEIWVDRPQYVTRCEDVLVRTIIRGRMVNRVERRCETIRVR